MQQNVTLRASAPTLAQAKGKAYNEIKKKYNNNVLVYGLIDGKQIKKPSEATTCKTQNFPPNGARKFITVYNIYAVNPVDDKDIKFVERYTVQKDDGTFSSDKTGAVKKAKELAIKNQLPYIVKVEKVLENEADQITASITPNCKDGTWEFTLSIETIN